MARVRVKFYYDTKELLHSKSKLPVKSSGMNCVITTLTNKAAPYILFKARVRFNFSTKKEMKQLLAMSQYN